VSYLKTENTHLISFTKLKNFEIMRILYSLPALFLVFLTGCFRERITGWGNISSETRTVVSTFNEIEVKDAINVFIKQGDSFKIVVKDYDNILPNLSTRVLGNRLIIDYQDVWINRSEGEVTVTMPRLTDIDVKGSSEIGTIGSFKFDDLGINISGSANMIMAGSAKNLNLKISGSGNLRAYEMPCDSARITISGSGMGQVNVLKLLDVTISGSGDLIYKGNPSITTRISGSGRIRKF
jgi:Putative auto-transporter adhesin, head GIN domain